jgi:hypothetical protein
MAGIVVEYPRTNFNFSNLALGQSQTQFVALYLSTGEWTEATLLVRSFGHTVGPNASMVVEVRRTSPTEEEPAKRFVPISATLVTVTIDNATAAAPLLLRGILPVSFGDLVEIAVRGTQASGSLQTITADLAIGMSLKRLAESNVARKASHGRRSVEAASRLR